MTKIAKHNEFLSNLKDQILKEAKEKDAQQHATGKPGADTNYERVSDSNEHTNKNDVGPDKLNDKQHHEQKPATGDPAIPINHAKKAEEDQAKEAEEQKKADEKVASEKTTEVTQAAGNEKLASLGQELLNVISKLQKEGQQHATGKPGADTNYERVSDKTEHTNKNDVGPDKLNDKQHHEQKPATGDPAIPTKTKKSEEEEMVDKIASFEFGRQVFVEAMKRAQVNEYEMAKQAARRDFETLIATAASQLENERPQVTKEAAEKAGYDAFQKVYAEQQSRLSKEAEAKKEDSQSEKVAAEMQKLKTELESKIASYAEIIQKQQDVLNKRAEEERENAKMAAWAQAIKASLLEDLKNEVSSRQ